MPLTLAQINAATQDAFTALLDGTYEHSSAWMTWRALPRWWREPWPTC